MDLAEIKAEHRKDGPHLISCEQIHALIAELEAAHHDIDRYVQISADQATELADLRAENERLRRDNDAGWGGLARLYKIITGKDCEQRVALGMATSAVVHLRQQLADLRAALEHAMEVGEIKFATNVFAAQVRDEIKAALETHKV